MNNSYFIRLTNYCLVEYMPSYGNIQYDFNLLHNQYSDINQIFNNDNALSDTQNSQDVTLTPFTQNRLVHLDSDLSPDFINYSNQLTNSQITSVNVVSDKVRFHFMAGFSFSNFDALGLSIRNTENDNNFNIFSYILLDAFTISELLDYNPKPLFITDAEFDRYVDIEVPSIKEINDTYYNPVNIQQQDTFAAKITPDHDGGYKGFKKDAPVTVSVDECTIGENIVTNTNEYRVFNVETNNLATLPQVNKFNNLGVTIREATDGDYIEYFATYNSNFPEDLVASLNNQNPNNDWVIIHQLSVFEQVGSNFINTDKVISFQESNYDSPQTFRPILEYADQAVSYSIDYTMRLVNRFDGEQIIRTASHSSLNTKKYGKSLKKLQLRNLPSSHNVYNRIVQKSYDSGPLFIAPEDRAAQISPTPQQTQVETVEQKVYTPIFFNANHISITSKNLTNETQNQNDQIIYGQGELNIIINPFDNAFKFKIFRQNENGEPVPIDLNTNAENYQIVFVDGKTKIRNDHIQDSSRENLSNGEIIFEVPEDYSETILNMSDRQFYVTAITKDDKETVMYRGIWYKPSEQDTVKENERQKQEQQQTDNQLETKIQDITEKIEQQQQSININNISNQSQQQDTPETRAQKIKATIPGYISDTKSPINANSIKNIRPKITTQNTSETS